MVYLKSNLIAFDATFVAEMGNFMNVTNDPLQYDNSVLLDGGRNSVLLKEQIIELLDKKIKYFNSSDSFLKTIDHEQAQYYKDVAYQICPLYVFAWSAIDETELWKQAQWLTTLAVQGHRMIFVAEGNFFQSARLNEFKKQLLSHRNVRVRESAGGVAELISEIFNFTVGNIAQWFLWHVSD